MIYLLGNMSALAQHFVHSLWRFQTNIKRKTWARKPTSIKYVKRRWVTKMVHTCKVQCAESGCQHILLVITHSKSIISEESKTDITVSHAWQNTKYLLNKITFFLANDHAWPDCCWSTAHTRQLPDPGSYCTKLSIFFSVTTGFLDYVLSLLSLLLYSRCKSC